MLLSHYVMVATIFQIANVISASWVNTVWLARWQAPVQLATNANMRAQHQIQQVGSAQ
jgi:hypothetical protein